MAQNTRAKPLSARANPKDFQLQITTEADSAIKLAGKTEERLNKDIRKKGAIHLTLIDPEETTPEKVRDIATQSECAGTSGIMVGGSTSIFVSHLDSVIEAIRSAISLPILLFPNNVSGISRHADAIWFMSLLNSSNPYWIIGAQALGAPLVKRLGVEAIPMGYVVVGGGGIAGLVGEAKPIPYDRPELATMYALAGEFLGMRFIYLEAGSGADSPVPPGMIRLVRSAVSSRLVVGGGIRTAEQARLAVKSGADIVVTGTIAEKSQSPLRALRVIVRAVEEGARLRRS